VRPLLAAAGDTRSLLDARSPALSLSRPRSWSFNYFFYNHRMKKVLFFTCSCTRISTSFGVATDTGRRVGPDGAADEEEDVFDFEDEEP
jgi:hypothetical protein